MGDDQREKISSDKHGSRVESDALLLRRYVLDRDDQALSRFISRHANWVYSMALRQVRDPAAASDVAQGTFILLSQKASGLMHRDDHAITGWLFRVVQFECSAALRNERRRKNREQEYAMSHADAIAEKSDPSAILSLIDQAVSKLKPIDQSAILLRFYRDLSFAELGKELGTTEEGARKRVERAIEKMRDYFTRRGTEVGAGTLTACLSEHLLKQAPAAILNWSQTTAHAQILATSGSKALQFAKLKLISLVSIGSIFLFGLAGLLATRLNAHQQTLNPAPPLASTQPIEATQPSAELNNGAYKGQVVDQKGKPVVGATLTYIIQYLGATDTSAGPQARTDENGQFVLPMVDVPGQDKSRSDLAIIETSPPVRMALILKKDQDTLIKLSPTTEVRLKVLDQDDKPLPGITLQPKMIVQGSIMTSFGSVLMPPAEFKEKWSVTTNAEGNASISGLPQGGNILLQEKSGDYQFIEETGRVSLEERSVLKAKPLKLQKLNQSIRGKVVIDKLKSPAVNVRITAQPTGSRGEYAETFTDTNGQYLLKGLSEGQYRVGYRGASNNEPQTAAPILNVSVKTNEQINLPDISMIEGTFIKGRVADRESGEPIKEIYVSAYAPYVDDEHYMETQLQGTKTSDKGEYIIRVPPGKAYLYISSGVIPGYDRAEGVRLTTSEASPAQHDFLLTKAKNLNQTAAQPFDGMVKRPDGSPAENAQIYVQPIKSDGQSMAMRGYTDATRSGKDGKFHFNNLALPARISVHSEEGFGTIKKVTAKSVTDNFVIETQPEAEYRLVVHVVDQDTGQRIPDADIGVGIMYDSGYGTSSNHLGDENGELVINHLWKDGNYDASATATGYSEARVNIKPPAKGTECVVEIKLISANESVEGILLDENGKALSGAKVTAAGRKTKTIITKTDSKGLFMIPELVGGDEVMLSCFIREGQIVRTVDKKIFAGVDKSVELHLEVQKSTNP